MSKKRREQVIRDLTNTINSEKEKGDRGNQDLVEKLSAILESVENGTYVSKLKKKKK